MRQDQGGVRTVALQVEWHPHQGADGLAVERLVADDVRRGPGRAVQAGDRRMGQLAALCRRDVKNPVVRWIYRALVRDEQPVAGRRKRGWRSGKAVDATIKGDSFGCSTCDIHQKEIRSPIGVDRV